MTPQMVVFLVLAAVAVAGAVNVVVLRHPIHSAISLIVVMVSLAGLFLTLEAEFIAALQIIVYAGAIMVLFVFVIMLLNAGVEERTNWSKIAWIGMFLSAVIIAGLGHWLYHSQVGGFLANTSAGTAPPVDTVDLSKQLFREYLFPFEATSILILIAMLGAMVLAKKDE